jgi:hypothetical protein
MRQSGGGGRLDPHSLPCELTDDCIAEWEKRQITAADQAIHESADHSENKAMRAPILTAPTTPIGARALIAYAAGLD